MLIYDEEICEQAKNPHVKFISYTGKYPCLCYGILTLEIDGRKCVFGHDYTKLKIGGFKDGHYDTFWDSGGDVDYKTNKITKGEWQIRVEELPEYYKEYAEEIDRVFNENVPYGCCGGCL